MALCGLSETVYSTVQNYSDVNWHAAELKARNDVAVSAMPRAKLINAIANLPHRTVPCSKRV